MTLDELKAQVVEDLRVNDEHLDTQSLKNQEIKAKYLDAKSKPDKETGNISEKRTSTIGLFLLDNIVSVASE